MLLGKVLDLESKLYVPDYNNECVVVLDKDTIRVFDTINSSSNSYTDYYVNSHYMSKKGVFGYVDLECLDSNSISSVPIYRNDIFDIIFVGLAFIFVGYFFISKLIRTIFLGWRWA